MKKIISSMFLWIVSISASTTAIAQSNKDAIALAHKMAGALYKTANLPGLSVAIMKDGKVIYAEGFGYADIEKKTKVTPATQFRTASVGKVITATGIGKLVQEGKLDLGQEVQHYVPAFPEKEFPITIRQLAGHLSGLPHYNGKDKLEDRFYPSVSDALQVFSHEALLFKPGTMYSYSTHGFTLLSAAMEKASGMPFLDYMRKEVFLPLGMSSTGPDLRANPSRNMSSLYNMSNGIPVKEEKPEDPSYKWAGGGLITSPLDLVKMAEGYFNGFLSKQTVDTLFKSQKLASGRETQVGIGWRLSQDVDGRVVRDHSGSMGGARSVIAIYPEQHAAIAIMTNAQWSSMTEETAQMMMLPFFSAPGTEKLPQGRFKLRVSSINGRNEKSLADGAIILKGRSGTLTTGVGFTEEKSMPIFHLQGNRYAWVRPDAICFMTIDLLDGNLTGKAVAYGTQLDHNPLTNPPFMEFKSTN